MPTPNAKQSVMIDLNYQYLPREIKSLLIQRLKDLGNNTIVLAKAQIAIFESDSLDELKAFLMECFKDNTTRNILIAYKVAELHWIGIHLHIKNGKLSYNRILSALNQSSIEVIQFENERISNIKEIINSIYKFHITDNKSAVHQASPVDSLIFTIENLAYSAANFTPKNPPSSKALRLNYTAILDYEQNKNTSYSSEEEESEEEEMEESVNSSDNDNLSRATLNLNNLEQEKDTGPSMTTIFSKLSVEDQQKFLEDSTINEPEETKKQIQETLRSLLQ